MTSIHASTNQSVSDSRSTQPVSMAQPPVIEKGSTVRIWTVEDLLGDANEAHIVHRGETYRLLRTRNQKLILVK